MGNSGTVRGLFLDSSVKPLEAWVEHFIESLEEQVRRYPTNSNEYFFWEELDRLVA